MRNEPKRGQVGYLSYRGPMNQTPMTQEQRVKHDAQLRANLNAQRRRRIA